MWDRLLAKVKVLEAANTDAGRDSEAPTTVVIKETLNCVATRAEAELFRRLGLPTIVVVRNPWLQLESRLACILARVEDGALTKFGVNPDKIDPATFMIGGDPVFRQDVDLTHLDFSPSAAASPWVQHTRHMKATRDYSSLGPGFVRLSAIHPIFEDPACQRDIWSGYAEDHPGVITADDINEWVGTPLDRFAALPFPMAWALCEWDIGWVAVQRFIDVVSPESKPIPSADAPERATALPRPQPRMCFVDFHDLCAAPNTLVTEIARMTALTTTPHKVGTYDFDLCSDGPAWEQWYLKSCDWDVLAAATAKRTVLRPSKRGPLAPEKFPAFLADHFADMASAYAAAIRRPEYIRATSSIVTTTAGPADPVYAYARAGPRERTALRNDAVKFGAYYDALDAAR